MDSHSYSLPVCRGIQVSKKQLSHKEEELRSPSHHERMSHLFICQNDEYQVVGCTIDKILLFGSNVLLTDMVT